MSTNFLGTNAHFTKKLLTMIYITCRSSFVSCYYIDSKTNKITVYTDEGTKEQIEEILRQSEININRDDFDIQEEDAEVDFLVHHGAKVFRNENNCYFVNKAIGHGSVACLATTSQGGLILLTAKHVLSCDKDITSEEGVYWSKVDGKWTAHAEGTGHGDDTDHDEVSKRYYGLLSKPQSGHNPPAIDIAALPLNDDVTSMIRNDGLYTMKQPLFGRSDDLLLDCKVWKVGVTTGTTHGRVAEVSFCWRFQGLKQEFFAVESLNEEPFAEEGDSGSLVW